MGTVRRDPSLADNALLPGALHIGRQPGRLLSAAERGRRGSMTAQQPLARGQDSPLSPTAMPN